MRFVTWQLAACAAGLGLAAGAFVLVSGPYRVLAAGVLGVAGILALWPLPAAESEHPRAGSRPRSRGRVAELEAEIARLAAVLERAEAERDELRGVLRVLDDWVREEAARAADGRVEEVSSWR